MKRWMEIFFGSYLGFSIVFFTGFSVLTWQWWVIVVPSSILAVVASSMKYERRNKW